MTPLWFVSQTGLFVAICLNMVIMVLKAIGIKYQSYTFNTCATTVRAVMRTMEKNYLCASKLAIKAGDPDKPIGLVIGKNYCAYVTQHNAGNWRGAKIGYDIMIIGFTILAPPKHIRKEKKKTPEINVILSKSAHLEPNLDKYLIKVREKPLSQQAEIVKAIIDMATTSESNNFPFNCVSLIVGPAGTGKSEIGKFIALELGGTFCNIYRPSQDGHSIYTFTNCASPSREEPLVIVIDEIDRIADFTPKENDKPSDWLTRDVKDKDSFNNLFDILSQMDNVIVICTSNKSLSELEKMDTHGSLFRDGRFHYKCELTTVIAKDMQERRFAHPEAEPMGGAGGPTEPKTPRTPYTELSQSLTDVSDSD